MLILLLVLIIIVLCLVFYYADRKPQQYFARPVITRFEQKMYIRLKQAFPDAHILAQVAFSALITNSDQRIRQNFNRKVTDFVLLDSKFQVVAIIELDDPSHKGKEKQDQWRDHMLNEAGYEVYRFKQIPTVKKLQQTFPTL